MDRCPTCQAAYRGGDVCYRCQTDLRHLLAIERDAVRYQQQALAALQSRHFNVAHGYARRAFELHRSPASIKALALTSLALRKFDEALVLWREYRRAA